MRKWIYWVISIILAITGLGSLFMTALLWLGTVILTPLGFLFGISEFVNYETTQKDLINLWWHVAPGLIGYVLSFIFLGLSGLLIWSFISIWQRSIKLRNAS